MSSSQHFPRSDESSHRLSGAGYESYGSAGVGGALQVVDSAFARLTDLMVELVVEQKLPIPRPFMRFAVSMMRRSVRKRAAFSIDDVAPLNFVAETHVPALFGEFCYSSLSDIHRCGICTTSDV